MFSNMFFWCGGACLSRVCLHTTTRCCALEVLGRTVPVLCFEIMQLCDCSIVPVGTRTGLGRERTLNQALVQMLTPRHQINSN
jgi:hypothetical protein